MPWPKGVPMRPSSIIKQAATVLANGQSRGTSVGSSKLCESDVRAILLSNDSYQVMADRLGVSNSAIANVRTGKTWTHVAPELARGSRRLPLHERFWARVNKNGPTVREELGACWVWTGCAMSSRRLQDYGVLGVGRKKVLTHRLSFEIANGEGAADGLDVLHRCDNTRCVNPAHLWLGTQADNNADMVTKNRRRGSSLRGERSPGARHSEAAIARFASLVMGGMSVAAAAAASGVSQPTAFGVASGKTWRHVTGGPLRTRGTE
jgi:HNH endonuclease